MRDIIWCGLWVGVTGTLVALNVADNSTVLASGWAFACGLWFMNLVSAVADDD
jgi:hypothetical protein